MQFPRIFAWSYAIMVAEHGTIPCFGRLWLPKLVVLQKVLSPKPLIRLLVLLITSRPNLKKLPPPVLVQAGPGLSKKEAVWRWFLLPTRITQCLMALFP